jgi:hypothetical protein
VEPGAVREALAAQLPEEFRLLSVAAVPVAAPSLSQELCAAVWRFNLVPEPAGRQQVEALAGAVTGSAAAVQAAQACAEAPLPPPALADWRRAIDGLLGATSLPWRDTDKKGRPRERDCRPYLLGLALLDPDAAAPPVGGDSATTWARPALTPGEQGATTAAAAPGESTAVPPAVTLVLEAVIDPQGRSLRPEQIARWLGDSLGRSLRLRAVERQSLRLGPC